MDQELIVKVIINGIMLGLFYAIFALGLTLIFGVIHILNFAHGELYMLGAFIVYYMFAKADIPYWLSFIVAVVAIAIVGMLFQYFFFRRFRGQLLPSYILSLGLLFGIQTAGMLAFGIRTKAVPSAITGQTSILGAIYPNERLIIIPVCIALVIALTIFVSRFKHGRAMRAVMQDDEAASLQGISISRISYLAMAIAGALAAATGALMAPIFIVNPYMGTPPLLKACVVIALGGIGSMPGCLIGGLMLGLLESVVTTWIDAPMASILGLALMFVVLIFRPSGLMGRPI